MRVWTDRAEPLEVRIEASRGGPATPLSDDELDAKFLDNAARASDAEVARRKLECVRSVGEGLGARALMGVLVEDTGPKRG